MRNVVVVILMLISLLAFAQGENKTDTKGLKQGEWKKYHKNGIVRYEGSFKNDKPIGEFKYYYDTGKIQRKMTHKKKGSYSITFNKGGGPQAIGKYVNQKKDSTWNFYDLDGYKIASDYYVNGEKNRTSYIYHQNGKVVKEIEFKNDFEQGFCNEYWDDGKKKMTGTYDKGSLEGKVIYFNSFGKRSISGYYYHGLRNGVWVHFDEDGLKVTKKEEFKNGKRVFENEDDKYINPEDEKPIDVEDIVNPENLGMPR